MKRKTDTLEDYREYPYDLEVEKKFLKHNLVTLVRVQKRLHGDPLYVLHIHNTVKEYNLLFFPTYNQYIIIC